MRSYGQFCPIAKAAELFCERWTPLVIRDLAAGVARFSDLQKGVPLMSPTLLSRRLKQLEAEGIVERRRTPGNRSFTYHLTAAGMEFEPSSMRSASGGSVGPGASSSSARSTSGSSCGRSRAARMPMPSGRDGPSSGWSLRINLSPSGSGGSSTRRVAASSASRTPGSRSTSTSPAPCRR